MLFIGIFRRSTLTPFGKPITKPFFEKGKYAGVQRLKGVRSVRREEYDINPMKQAGPHEFFGRMAAVAVENKEPPLGGIGRFRMRDEDLTKPLQGYLIVGPAVVRNGKIPILVRLAVGVGKPLLLNVGAGKDD